MRDPRPILLIVGAALGVLLVYSLYSQPPGNPASAPLVSTLTTLFVAVLAAYVAVHTLEFLNRTNQVREWRRDDAHKILKPVYDDLLRIVPVIAKLESPDFAQFKPDFTQAEGSWQDWGLGNSRLTEFVKEVENYQERQGRATDAAYKRFAVEVRIALGTAGDPADEVLNPLYPALYGWAATFGALTVDTGVAMTFAAKYSTGATRRGNDTSPAAALELLTKVFAAIANEPDVEVFRTVAEQMLHSAEKLRDEVRQAIRGASGIGEPIGSREK